MTMSLKKIYRIQILLITLGIVLILNFIFFNFENEKIISNFNMTADHELHHVSNHIEIQYLMSLERLNSQSSRTMIKRKLEEYAEGKISLEDLQSYTEEKYLDGISVFKGLQMAKRTTSDNKTVTFFNKGNINNIPKYKNNELIFFIENEKNMLYLKNTIFSKGNVIGFDEAVFQVTLPENIDYNHIGNLKIVKNSHITESKYITTEIGSTGYKIEAKPEYDKVKKDFNKTIGLSMLKSLLLIFFISLTTHFTINKLVFQIIDKYEKVSQERALLLKEVHHRVKNNLNQVISYIELLGMKEGKCVDKDLVISKIRSYDLIHQQLQVLPDNDQIDLSEYLAKLGNLLISTLNNKNITFNMKSSDSIRVVSKTASDIGLLCSELIVNSYKHGYVKNSQLSIDLSLEKKNSQIILTYSDDGKVFLQSENKNTETLGTLIIEGLIDTMNGEIQFNPEEKVYYFKIPV